MSRDNNAVTRILERPAGEKQHTVGTARYLLERMLLVAIEKLGGTGEPTLECPFKAGEPLSDGLHVDSSDRECYARQRDVETVELAEACSDCIAEHLEELAEEKRS